MTHADWEVVKRWSQTVTETYMISVQNAGSIARHGEMIYEDGAGYQSDYDDTGFDAGTDTRTPGWARNRLGDYYEDQVERDEADHMLRALIQIADVRIAASHRQNFISWEVQIEPAIERGHSAEIDIVRGRTDTRPGSRIQARGKVFQTIHRLDIDSGKAVTNIKIAVSKCWPGGSQDELVAPLPPDSQPQHAAPAHSTVLRNRIGNTDTAPPFDEAWTGFTGKYTVAVGNPANDQKYPRRFRVVTPDIEPESRDEVQAEALEPAIYHVLGVDEPLTISIDSDKAAPVQTVPAAQSGHQEDALALGGISIDDPEGDIAAVRLFVNQGALHVALSGAAAITAGANDSGDLTLSGPQADINAAIATLTYTGNAGFNGRDALSVFTTDHNGATTLDTVELIVDLPLPVDLIVDEAAHAHASDHPDLTVWFALHVNKTLHAHRADPVDLTQASILSVDDATHAHASISPNLNEVILTPDESVHAHRVDPVELAVPELLSLDNTVNAHNADPIELAITVPELLIIEDMIHSHAADNIGLQLPVSAPTPVHWWKLDEAAGNFADSGSGTALELLVSGGIVYRQPGIPGVTDAFAISKGAISNYLYVSTFTALLPQDNENYTIEFFAKWTEVRTNACIFSLSRSTTSNNLYNIFVNYPTVGNLVVTRGSAFNTIIDPGLTNMNNGDWHHIVITHQYNGSDNHDLILYVDGLSVGSVLAQSDVSTFTMRIGVGRHPNFATSTLPDTTFDEIRIYDQVLTPALIEQRYQDTIA